MSAAILPLALAAKTYKMPSARTVPARPTQLMAG